MPVELGEVVAAWPLAASLAAAVLARGWGVGRRRAALNEALHELRRPLQALALTGPGPLAGQGAQVENPVWAAAAALARLECEINGEATATARSPLEIQPLLEGALARWRPRAQRGGAELSLGAAAEAIVVADRDELTRALDNLIVNALEHGGREVLVEARAERGRLRIAVRDSGNGRPASSRWRRAGLSARLTGRSRRGHGLRVVRRAAARHGGEFKLRPGERGTEAVLELPLVA